MQIDTEWKYYVSQKMIAKWRQKWSGVTQDLAGEGDKYQSPPKIQQGERSFHPRFLQVGDNMVMVPVKLDDRFLRNEDLSGTLSLPEVAM